MEEKTHRHCNLCDDCLVAPTCTNWCDKVRAFLIEHWEEKSREYGDDIRREQELRDQEG